MNPVRVLIVDDSAVIRGIITRMISEEEGIEVIASAQNGEIGVRQYERHRPDVVLMDIEMPVMDGLTALKHIVELDAKARVIMCSTLTKDNADVTMRAMRIGAVDYIPKPTSSSEINGSNEFKSRLIRLLKAIRPEPATRAASTALAGAEKTEKVETLAGVPVNKSISLRPKPPLHWKPEVIAVGSSTGGPQALFKFLKELKGVQLPIVITQHMPATFTATLAEHITQQTGLPCAEAKDGMVLEKGKAILAAGGLHMVFVKDTNGSIVVHLDNGPAENFCKPAVDVMMRSLMTVSGSKILSVILTGMGSDGMKESQRLVEQGGFCMAQDQATSVVWGMPGAVANAGICCAVEPLDKMAEWIFNNANVGTRKAS